MAVGLGKVGVALSGAGAAASNIIYTDVSAYISTSSDVQAYNITVNADDIATIDSVVLAASVAAAFGSVGVALSIGVSIATNEIANVVSATVDGNSLLNGGVGGSSAGGHAAGIFITASNPELPLEGASSNQLALDFGGTSTTTIAANLDNAIKGDTNEDGTYSSSEEATVNATLADLKDRMLAQGANVVGDIQITEIQSETFGGDDRESKGAGWLVVDEEGSSWS